jgi:hypothetical protein
VRRSAAPPKGVTVAGAGVEIDVGLGEGNVIIDVALAHLPFVMEGGVVDGA